MAGILGKLNPPANVRIVNLPGLPDGGDIADWLEARDRTEPAGFRAQVEELAGATPRYFSTGRGERAGESEVHSEFTRACVEYAGRSTDAPSVYHRHLAVWLIGAALGNRVFVQFGARQVFPNIYGLLLGAPGVTRKTTARYYQAVRPETIKAAIVNLRPTGTDNDESN